MQNLIKKFKTVQSELEKKSWFKKDKWLVSIHPFPSKNPDAVTFHVYKKNWFNENHSGIHVESFLYIDSKKRKKSYVTLHLLHEEKIPGTNLKRIALAKPFVDEIYEEVKMWDGYKFRVGKYGMQPFSKDLDGANEDFEKNLVEEVSKICKNLGPVVDTILKQVMKK
jgi:hypothetical protein